MIKNNKNLKGVKLFLLDMDGTVYCENQLIDGAVDKVGEMQSKRKICFLTNNSSRSQEDYVVRLNKLGFNVSAEEIYTSGNATVRYLNKFAQGKKVFLLGRETLRKQFLQGGICLVEENPDIVVVGYDTALTYSNLCKATTFIAQGAQYITTHADINCPASPVYLPDVGSFIALIEKSTGKLPSVICGKPYLPMGEAIAQKFGFLPNEIAMVGDRLCTDMQFALNNGFVSILVLSGETKQEDYEKWGQQCDYVLPSIADISLV